MLYDGRKLCFYQVRQFQVFKKQIQKLFPGEFKGKFIRTFTILARLAATLALTRRGAWYLVAR